MHSELSEWVSSVISRYEIVKSFREGSNRTGVWKVKNIRGSFYYVKSFSRDTRWHPEVYAYKNWIPLIQEFAPRLIDTYFCNNIYAIIITPLGEYTVREYNSFTKSQIYEAFYKAGHIAKILHSIKGEYFGRPDYQGNPIELKPETNPVKYMEESIYNAFRKCVEVLSAEDVKKIEHAIKNCDIFKEDKPSASSWDCSPNNWTVDSNGNFLGFIDFENMLWTFDLDMFTILFDRYFPRHESSMEAYFKGYGENVLLTRSEKVRIVNVNAAINNISYGISTGDERLVTIGKGMLKQL